jgi:hypothetical protein
MMDSTTQESQEKWRCFAASLLAKHRARLRAGLREAPTQPQPHPRATRWREPGR